MKQLQDHSVQYYDDHAAALYQHYENIGTREGDIDLAFALAGDPFNARVLELGCGYGREARGILSRTPHYVGVDASTEFIDLARKYEPRGHFIAGNLLEYEFDGPLDLVFSFAAFRHLDQEEVTHALRKAYRALRPGGIVYISCNYGHQYEEYLHEDDFGLRLFYLYNPSILLRLAGSGYTKVHEATDYIGGIRWFEVALQKIV
jgi:SAM-dependent methyltransferase